MFDVVESLEEDSRVTKFEEVDTAGGTSSEVEVDASEWDIGWLLG